MNNELKSMRCRCCSDYDSFAGCVSWTCNPEYSPSKIKEEAESQGMTVADIVALLQLADSRKDYDI